MTHAAEVSGLVVDPRFAGPPDSANGGYFAGLVARHFQTPVEVTLRRPIPLGRSLALEWYEDLALVCDEGELLATAEPSEVRMAVPGPPSYQESVYATRFLTAGMEHPFPRCFVCGSDRAESDGLGILPGRVEGTNLVAAPWVPAAEFSPGDGSVYPEIVHAALDCPGGWAAMWGREPRPVVLGRFAARIDRAVYHSERYVVVGWTMRSEGRKHDVGTAVFAVNGDLCALARATWIELR